MESELTKQKADQFMRIQGKIRGVGLKNYGDFILKEEGKTGLKRLERKLEEVGYPIQFGKMGSMDFFPLGFQALTIEAIKEVFGYDRRKFQELGAFEPKISLIMRLFMKYFVSIDKLAKKVPDMWKKYYTAGNLGVEEIDKSKKKMVLRLNHFPCHPLQCETLRGYFRSVLQMVIKGRASCEVTQCDFKGENYHEYVLRW